MCGAYPDLQHHISQFLLLSLHRAAALHTSLQFVTPASLCAIHSFLPPPRGLPTSDRCLFGCSFILVTASYGHSRSHDPDPTTPTITVRFFWGYLAPLPKPDVLSDLLILPVTQVKSQSSTDHETQQCCPSNLLLRGHCIIAPHLVSSVRSISCREDHSIPGLHLFQRLAKGLA